MKNLSFKVYRRLGERLTGDSRSKLKSPAAFVSKKQKIGFDLAKRVHITSNNFKCRGKAGLELG